MERNADNNGRMTTQRADAIKAFVRESKEILANLPIPSGFNEIKRSSKPSLFYSARKANYPETTKILTEAGLKAINYKEALSSAQELIGTLAEKYGKPETLNGRWFYLGGSSISGPKGMRKYAAYTVTFNARGELLPLTGKEKSFDQMVSLFPGRGRIALSIYPEYFGINRFTLGVDDKGRRDIAPLVVGLREEDAVKQGSVQP